MRKVLSFILCFMLAVNGFAQFKDDGATRKGNVPKKKSNRTHLGLETIRQNTVKNPIEIQLATKRQKTNVPRAMQGGDGTTLYGEVTYSTLMNGDSQEDILWGLYSFQAKENTTFKDLLIHNTICANGGGAYRKGKLYFTSYYEGWEPGQLLYLYFCTLDVNTLTLEKKALSSDKFTSIGLDMTYDPVGDVMFMQAYPDNAGSTDNPIYTLSTMNLETGLSTPIAALDRMSMIACDINGELYGVRYKDGMFCRIDKTTAKVTEIGSTGIQPYYNGSGTFDYKSRKLYWSTSERLNETSGLYEIDITTGKATLVTTYPNDEQVSCLYIPQADDICQLGDIQLLEANFPDPNSTEGTIKIQAPSTDAAGAPITGDVTISLYIDNRLHFAKLCAPGSTLTENVTLEKGAHKVEAVASHTLIGKSQKKSIDVWVGADGPAAVSELKATKTGDYEVTLTWKQPTIGAHGGTINPNLVYYEIRRMPGNDLISTDAVGESFVDKIANKNMRYYTYIVKSFTKGIEGNSATSNRVVVGDPSPIPYKETFDDFEAFKTYLVNNANKDDGFWGYNLDTQCPMYKYDTFNNADDWLISPAFSFDKEKTYKLKFKARSDSRMYPEDLEVYLGSGPDVEEMTKVLIKRTTLEHEDFREYEAAISIPETGFYFIGFHAVTQKGQYYLYVDDVEILNGPSALAPGLVTEFKVDQAPNGENKAIISFVTPNIDVNGNPLKALTAVKIFRNNTLIKTFENPEQGVELNYTDESPETGFNTYKVIAENETGEGLPVEEKQWIGPDVPTAPTNVKHITNNGTEAVISWEAPVYGENGGTLNPADVTYNIYDNKENLVKEGVTGTTYTDVVDVTDGQKTRYYYVSAVTAKGESLSTASNFITYGKAYQDDFKESFAEGKFTTSDWLATLVNPSPLENAFYGRYWGFIHSSKYDRGPIPEAQDGDNGYLIAYTDMPGVSSRMISPKINVSGLKNPVLSFWFYHYYNTDTENGYSHVDETMTVETYVDGKFTEIIDKPIRLVNGNGWYRYDIKLDEFVGDKDFQVAFKTHNYLSYDMHIDNIRVIDVKDNDLSISDFTVPAKIAVGSSRTISAVVHNSGAKTANNYTVEFLRDGKVFETVTADEALEFAADKTFTITVKPEITEAGKSYKYSARVVLSNDEDLTNNTTEEITSEVPSNNLPVVNTLKASSSNGNVELTWEEPAEQFGTTSVTEGFESYTAFTISEMGDWKLVDNDKMITFTIQNTSSETGDYNYPNAGEAMAYQVFNPSEINLTSPLWTPYLGNQMAVCFNSAGAPNDDWLISPMVKGGTTVSFMAKSVTANYGLEKFKFCYSTSSDDVTSFVPMGDVIAVPANEWTLYEFTLPESAKYFAINCVSNQAFAMLLDEITYESMQPVALSLYGFNVYRDGLKINDAIVEEPMFVDNNVEVGTNHNYNVTVIYDKGESAFSNTANVTSTGITNVESSNSAVYATNGAIHIDNATGKAVKIYNTSGQITYSGVVSSDRFTVQKNSGIYLVAVNGKTTKVYVK